MREDMDSSKNEILIAIFLGILIGFVAVLSFYFIFRNRSRLNLTRKTSVNLTEKTSSKKGANGIAENFDLTLDPEDSEIVSQVEEFNLSGVTDKNALVFVQTDETVTKLTPDANGKFSTKIQLTQDVTQVFVTAILQNSQEKTIEKTIFFEKKQ